MPETVTTVVEDVRQRLSTMTIKPTQNYVHGPEWTDIQAPQSRTLQNISRAHIESFNFMTSEGIQKGIQNLNPIGFQMPNGDRVQIQIMDCQIFQPTIKNTMRSNAARLFPSECRMSKLSYKGRVMLTINWTLNGKVQEIIEEIIGDIPIMVKSNRCNLEKFTTKAEFIRRKEDAEELGGYFIMNGNEYLIRKLIAQRRNYPMAIIRPSWKGRGMFFSEYGISIRCVRNDQIGSNMVLHYLTNGTVKLTFFYHRQPIFLPLILVLKCLSPAATDQFIFNELIKTRENDSFFKSCILNMLRMVQQEKLYTSRQIRAYIGERVRVKYESPPWLSNEEVTDMMFRECIAIHLNSNREKFQLLAFMTRKLFSFVQNECAEEKPDNPMFHEIYQSGHIYFSLFLDRLQEFLSLTKTSILYNYQLAMKKSSSGATLTSAMVRKSLASRYKEITRAMDHLISTGSVRSRTGLGLMQTAGISVKAEKINFWRFLAHFRSVHRGQFFTEMKTTACRKLYPESWGFLCPVHTPDGSPCGLLNHFTEWCEITNNQSSVRNLIQTLNSLGMEPIDSPVIPDSEYLTVLLDGRVIGLVRQDLAKKIATELRMIKTSSNGKIPLTLEIALVPPTSKPTQFPGLYLFSTPSRMIRPVYNLLGKTIEMIGTFEQCYMDICVCAKELIPDVTTHQELRETSFLSILARQIPYPDFNQSPRNMYSCQMAKQTMGTASHTLRWRSDNKMYSVMAPQSPLVRTAAYDNYQLDEFPLGTNAVVAVISYTGYDMEDAMIINKSSMERGFQAGIIHKTEIIDLYELSGLRSTQELNLKFGYENLEERYQGMFDDDGLPYIGRMVTQDDPVCAYIDLTDRQTKFHKYKSSEPAYVYDVKILSNPGQEETSIGRVAITYLIRRSPIIGDKFANRHGQKGICSFLWPAENMPFTESGIIPDILFNPHGFPSRMTIGQMIETLAGKAGSMYGHVHDCTPFTFSEDNLASDYYGKLLESCGFNYYGTEKMFSGISGRELEAKIFIGVVYYYRLRHMVGDKYQVRSTGPIDQITHQPVKGRKRAGGIRFGEMERDSLLSHGTTFLLQDRLFNCSDRTLVHMCQKCGSILSPYMTGGNGNGSENQTETNQQQQNQIIVRHWSCKICETDQNIVKVSIPFVLLYLVSELASVNIKVKFSAVV